MGFNMSATIPNRIQQLPLFPPTVLAGDIVTRHGSERIYISAHPASEELEAMFSSFIGSSPWLLDRLVSATEIWVKPNITSAESPDQGRTTQPDVLYALLTAIRKLLGSEGRIYVADSSVIGCDTKSAARVAGILDVCEQLGVAFVDLRDVPYRSVRIKAPLLYETLEINSPFATADVFKVNLAKIKTTYGSPVGFCVKNNKGVIPDELKYAFHLRGVQRALCDLDQALSWDMCLLEGLPMSQLGKGAGNGPLGLSTSAVVLDTCMCVCCGVPLSDVFHLQTLAEMYGIGTQSLLEIDGFHQLQSMCPKLSYSEKGLADLAREFSVDIADGKACSACTESFAKALARLLREDMFPANDLYVLGADSDTELCGRAQGSIALVGNCSFDKVAMDLVRSDYSPDLVELWRTGLKIQGCPPTIDDMVRILSSEPEDVEEDARIPVHITMSSAVQGAFDISPLQVLLDSECYPRLLPHVPREAVSFEELGFEQLIACEVICASICHQINWDFLRRRILDAMLCGAQWWNPEHLADVRSDTIRKLLSGYQRPERIRARERALMIRSLSELFHGNVRTYSDLVLTTQTDHRDPSEIIGKLAEAAVFSEDPLRKKMQVLLHSLVSSQIVPDAEPLCEPAVDHHIMRLFLRRGDVHPTSALGIAYLESGGSHRASTVTALRSVVSKALSYACRLSGFCVPYVNRAEWWIGRSVCHQERPDCELHEEPSAWLRRSMTKCPFIDACFAYNCDPRRLATDEPRHVGGLY